MQTSSQEVKADDRCGVCQETRENHGDKHHQFDIEGMLKPLQKPEVGRQAAPSPRRADEMAKDPVAQVMLRLIEVLGNKGILTPYDNIYIFGGGNYAPDRGEPEAEASTPGGESSTKRSRWANPE